MHTEDRIRQCLNGRWEFCLDPYDEGMELGWRTAPLADTITVPGTWMTQGKYLPENGRHYTRGGINTSVTAHDGQYLYEREFYYGTVWYARDIEIPEYDGRIFLCLDGAAPTCFIYLDGQQVGYHEDGPYLPVRVELTGAAPGAHRLAIRMTQHNQRIQGLCKAMIMGLWRDVYLESTANAFVDEMYVHGDPDTGEVQFEALLCGDAQGIDCRVTIADEPALTLTPEGGCVRAAVRMSRFTPWSEHAPQLYWAKTELLRGGEVIDTASVRFGLRRFTVDGHRILLNGTPVFMRGCGLGGRQQMDTFLPRADAESAHELIDKAQSYGFNWIRTHSGFWSEECLDAADEKGVFMGEELAMTLWSDEEERALTRRQWNRLIRRYRNHPCIWIWSMGNEMGSPDPTYRALAAELYDTAKRMTPDILVTISDGVDRTTTNVPYNDVNMVSPGVGVSVSTVLDIGPSTRVDLASCPKPLVVHELGYIESYPETKPMGDETREWVRPMARHMLRIAGEKGIPDDTLRLWGENSERLCTLGYYTGMENLRRVNGVAGYNQWIFMDSAEECSGIVREDLTDKTGMNADIARRVNGETVALMSPLMDRYTIEDGETWPMMLHVSHHGAEPLSGVLRWRLLDGAGGVLDSGEEHYTVAPACTADMGPVQLHNPARGQSEKLTLVLETEAGGKPVYNEYPLWSIAVNKPESAPMPVYQLMGSICFIEDRVLHRYPFAKPVTEMQVWKLPPESVLLANTLLPSVVDFIKRGGRVLYIPVYYLHGSCSLPSLPSSWGNVASWSGTNSNCGSVINDHPLLDGIPHDGWAHLQFYDLLSGARTRNSAPYWNCPPSALDLDAFPRKPFPIIRSLGYCTRLNDRAHLIEFGAGKGAVIAASMRVYEDLGTHPESKRFMDNAIAYIASDAFRPEVRFTDEEFDSLIRSQNIIMD